MDSKKYVCPKCGNRTCEISEMRATKGFLAKLFDVQNLKFTTVTCNRCKYTEFYKADKSTLEDIFDLFT